MKRERRLELRKLLEGGEHAKILIQIHQLETDVEHYEQTLESLTKENDDLKEWRKKTQDYIRTRDGQITDLHMRIGDFEKIKKLSIFLAEKMEEIVCSNCMISPIHTCDGTVAGLMAARDTHDHCKGCSTIEHTETFKKGEFPEGFEEALDKEE